MAECSSESRFLDGVSIPSNVGFSVAPLSTPKGIATTINLDNVEIGLLPAQRTSSGVFNQTAIATKIVTLNVPYATDQSRVRMRMNVHGLLDPTPLEPGMEARLIACAGDTTKVIDLSQRDVGGFYNESFEFTVHSSAAEPKCQVTLWLFLEHDTDIDNAGEAALSVQSLNLEILSEHGAYDL
jgi:hypothetical protein